MADSQASLADTLYRLRTQARLTQDQLAVASGISKQQIGSIERARDPRTSRPPQPRVATLRRLADALALRADTGQVNQEKADRYYNQLAAAAGYFLAGQDDPRRPSPRERAQALLARNPRAATAFEALPADLDDDDVDALARHLEVFADLLRRRHD